MAYLFNKFHAGVKVLAKSPTFARDIRHLQFEADINRLFLYTSYNRLGKDAAEADAEEIIDMASKAPLADQQKLVQENIHSQIQTFCMHMDDILLPDEPINSHSESNNTPRRSGLGLAVGLKDRNAVSETKALTRVEVSQRMKDLMGYTLGLKPSLIPDNDAGQGLFLDGEVDVGAVVAFYPGVVYSPAYYRYIPGYPKIDAQNPYLITRYDGSIINAQPWGTGADTREVWDGLRVSKARPNVESSEKGSDRVWKMLSTPLDGKKLNIQGEVLERRNPLAFAHFANHPPKGTDPNVMVCSYDFPLTEKNMRTYIPNIQFGGGEEANMKRFGSFWFKGWRSKSRVSDIPILKALILVATRTICDEEILLNYRLSNSKQRPSWYTPVDEEEDRRRWG